MIAILIIVILILCGIFATIVKWLMPVLIILGLIIICVVALTWVVKSSFKKDDPKV